jgi:hypothetical protein
MTASATSKDPRTVRTVRYLTGIPRKPLPPGHVVVHNHVRPSRRLGNRGFRAWLAAPNDVLDAPGVVVDPVVADAADPRGYEVERCGCGWAPELAEHYRVVAPT